MLKDNTILIKYKIDKTSLVSVITFFVFDISDGSGLHLNCSSSCIIKGDYNTAINKLKSTLHSIGLCGLAETYKMVNSTNVDLIDLNDIDWIKPSFRPTKNFIKHKQVSFKEQLISRLEECLKQLKNE